METHYAKVFIKPIESKNYGTRIGCNLVLENLNARDLKFKNYMNMEVQPSRPLEISDFQLLMCEKGYSNLLQGSAKGIMLENIPIQCGIGTYESGDKYYFIKAELSESVFRTFYLNRSQVMMLKYVNLGFEFEDAKEDEVPVVDDINPEIKEEVESKRKKPVVEEV